MSLANLNVLLEASNHQCVPRLPTTPLHERQPVLTQVPSANGTLSHPHTRLLTVLGCMAVEHNPVRGPYYGPRHVATETEHVRPSAVSQHDDVLPVCSEEAFVFWCQVRIWRSLPLLAFFCLALGQLSVK